MATATATRKRKVKQPYKNMAARSIVLFVGFALSVVGFVLVTVGFIYLFAPGVNVADGTSPLAFLTNILISGLALDFVGTVLTVSGANTHKGFARLSMFLSSTSFIAGAGVLMIVLLFKTILPVEALQRLAACILL